MSIYNKKSKIDLHIHTKHSDGTDSPEKVLDLAWSNELQYISITDHESMNAYKNIIEMNKYNISIIPGVELHTFYKGHEIHLLAYGLDHANADIEKYLEKLRLERTGIAFETVERLRKSGVSITWEEVLKKTRHNSAITKAHVISALREKNIFDRKMYFTFFNTEGSSYLPYTGNPFETALDIIHSHKAKPVLAHPGLIFNDIIVEDLVKKYRIGLEVFYNYYGKNQEEWIKKYKTMANNYDILYTGGSDYHGHITPSEIGGVYVPEIVIEKLLL